MWWPKIFFFSLENNREVPFVMETLLSMFLLFVPPEIRLFTYLVAVSDILLSV